MPPGAPRSFGAQLKALREAAGYTQEELATIAGLSVHAVSALERGERRRPQFETVRALSQALDLTGATRDAFAGSARTPADHAAADELGNIPLPLSLTSFVGRGADLQTLLFWLADPALRLVTLVGPGGVGKTRLALEAAQRIASDGQMRVLFVPLAAIRERTFVASAIAEAFGQANTATPDLAKRLRLACADRPALLVLDNFEQVLAAAPLVTELLTSLDLLRVMVTSRAPLRVRGEREFSVEPLALEAEPDQMLLTDSTRSPAVQLFVERVLDVQPAFQLTPANGATVTAICRRLDALPLALEIAAPWMKVLTAEDLLSRLAHDVLLSGVGPRDLPERQQTMNATVAWSYQLLSPNEQHAFRRLGALPGRFSIDAAAAVLDGRERPSTGSGAALSMVAALIDKSLLVRAETSVAARPLYVMLETVRAYAASELAASGERDDALRGLARYCASEALRTEAELVGPAQAEWLDRVTDDLENYRGVMTWLIDRGCPDEASDIAWRLIFFWLIRAHAAEGRQWYERVLEAPSLPPLVESRALVGAALMCFVQGDLDAAHTALARSLPLAKTVGDRELVARAQDVSARVEHARGDLKAARDRFADSVRGFNALAISWGAGNAMIGMAGAALAAGDGAEAGRLLDEATSVLEGAGPWFVTRAHYTRAILEVRRGNPDRAIALVRESLTRIRELHDRFAFVYALVPLAAAAMIKGDAAWAARILGARDAVSDVTGTAVVLKSVHDIGETAEQQARARLGPDRWAAEYGAGRKCSIDALLHDIDDVARREALAD